MKGFRQIADEYGHAFLGNPEGLKRGRPKSRLSSESDVNHSPRDNSYQENRKMFCN